MPLKLFAGSRVANEQDKSCSILNRIDASEATIAIVNFSSNVDLAVSSIGSMPLKPPSLRNPHAHPATCSILNRIDASEAAAGCATPAAILLPFYPTRPLFLALNASLFLPHLHIVYQIC